ncbi:MAG: CPBP family intramembrane metalloprotease [Myxococcales bacterium]|nr:MAG: CPBP family intramembrane metalloprotease [Myxococcales bacterium]
MTEPQRLSPGLALGWALLLTLVLYSANVAIGLLLGPSNLAVAIGGPVELLLIWPAAKLLGKVYGHDDTRRDLALGAAAPVELLLGASLGVLLHLPVGYLSALVERRFPTPERALELELSMLTPSSSAMAVAMFLSIAVVVAFIEEAYFRGALFTALQRSNAAFVALWTTSIAFALMHPKPRDWAPLFVVALVLGELRRRAASVWPGIALHAAFNATTLLFVFITRPSEVKPQESSWPLALMGSVLTVSGVVLFGRVAGRRLGEVS